MARFVLYPTRAVAAGLFALVHAGAVLLAGLLLLVALVLFLFGLGVTAGALALLALGVLCSQMYSRVSHISAIRGLRYRRGSLEVRLEASGDWVPFDQVRSVRSEDFMYADPWRPFTLGYPGLSFRLDGNLGTARHLYPRGFEGVRDELLLHIREFYPGVEVEAGASGGSA